MWKNSANMITRELFMTPYYKRFGNLISPILVVVAQLHINLHLNLVGRGVWVKAVLRVGYICRKTVLGVI